MTTTKSVPDSTRTRSAYGWSAAEGFGPWTAAMTLGVAAIVSATARARAIACWSPARCAWPYAPTSPAPTTSTAMRTCSANVCAATLQRPGAPSTRVTEAGTELNGIRPAARTQ